MEEYMDFLREYKTDVDKMCVELDSYEKRKLALMCLERQFKVYEQFIKEQKGI